MPYQFELVEENDLPRFHEKIINELRHRRSEPIVHRWVNSDTQSVLYFLSRTAVMEVSLEFLLFFQNRPLNFSVKEEFLIGYQVKYFKPPYEITKRNLCAEQAIIEGLEAYCDSMYRHHPNKSIATAIPKITFDEHCYCYWNRGSI